MIHKQSLWQSYVVVTILIGLCIYAIFYQAKNIPAVSPIVITTFEECALAGNLIMESYPRQCMYDGVTYIEDVSLDTGVPIQE